MKAVVRNAYGPPDVLELRDIDIPEFTDDEVLLRVRAAGVGRDVWHVMAGLPYPIRLAGFGFRAPKNPVIGSDLAGVVEAFGDKVSRFQPGEEVFGVGKGAYAEYVCALEDKLASKPANLTFEQAAVVPIMGSTALQALRDHGKVRQGQEVLIIGASGGVGTYAVQIAKAFGARVTGVSSTQKVKMVRSLGADHVIDYKREDFADGERRYDLILDIGGNSSLTRLRRALASRGTLVIVGGEGGGRWLGAPIARSGRCCYRRSWARSWARSSIRRTTRTCSLSRSSSNRGRLRPSSTGPTRSPRSPKPSGICKKDTSEERSSSPWGKSPKRLFTGVRRRLILRRLGRNFILPGLFCSTRRSSSTPG
jgi:NADPH:quinone reductase-like Zn-dependent oxidoreductase